ncbi:unnamed protein product [Rhodiola kirilowii]
MSSIRDIGLLRCSKSYRTKDNIWNYKEMNIIAPLLGNLGVYMILHSWEERL